MEMSMPLERVEKGRSEGSEEGERWAGCWASYVGKKNEKPGRNRWSGPGRAGCC